jgi:pSer/pThr/pTyr-binding forkhead associated (FHA) protein
MEDDNFTRIVGPPAPSADAARMPAPGERPALVWRPRLGEEHAFALDGRAMTVGRHEENDIVLAGPTVSGRHATVTVEGGRVAIEDEGSLNGTFVNGDRVERAPLRPGDQVQIGPHLLVFVPARV